jgi:hypothetical protein
LPAWPGFAQTIPRAVDFAVCAAQSHLVGEMYEKKGNAGASATFKIRARFLLNLARELDRQDKAPAAAAQRTYDDAYQKFRGSLSSPEGTLALLRVYLEQCTKIVETARKISPSFPQKRLTR